MNLAYKKAYGLGLVKNKADFAIKVGVNVASMSKALNGDDNYATENLCKKIRDTFPTIEIIGNFSPSITGNGNTFDYLLGNMQAYDGRAGVEDITDDYLDGLAAGDTHSGHYVVERSQGCQDAQTLHGGGG